MLTNDCCSVTDHVLGCHGKVPIAGVDAAGDLDDIVNELESHERRLFSFIEEHRPVIREVTWERVHFKKRKRFQRLVLDIVSIGCFS